MCGSERASGPEPGSGSGSWLGGGPGAPGPGRGGFAELLRVLAPGQGESVSMATRDRCHVTVRSGFCCQLSGKAEPKQNPYGVLEVPEVFLGPPCRKPRFGTQFWRINLGPDVLVRKLRNR